MDSDDPVVDALLEAISEAPGVRIVGIVCLTVSPFTVSVNGLGSIPAERFFGQTFDPGDTGRALWSPPSKPICFKVT